MIASADLVLTMEAGQKEALRIEFPDKSEQIWMLSEMVGQRYDIEDPIGQPLDEFQRTAELLDDILERGLEQIIERTTAV